MTDLKELSSNLIVVLGSLRNFREHDLHTAALCLLNLAMPPPVDKMRNSSLRGKITLSSDH